MGFHVEVIYVEHSSRVSVCPKFSLKLKADLCLVGRYANAIQQTLLCQIEIKLFVTCLSLLARCHEKVTARFARRGYEYPAVPEAEL